MRWLILFLLILNALVFVWFNFQKEYLGNEQPEQASAFDLSSVESLRLLDKNKSIEIVQEKPIIKPTSVSETEAADYKPAVINQCYVVGSYPEVISARQGRLDLTEHGVQSKVVQLNIKLPAVNWIYIPAHKTRKEALLVLKQLQDRRIDSFLVSEAGEYENAISLGFYGNAESAKAILRERIAQGYNAKMVERVREKKAYWLGVGEILSDAQLQEIDKKIDSFVKVEKTIKKQEISCQELALMESIN